MTTEEVLRRRVIIYMKAINRIDDFFEYRNESKKDREVVHKILDALTVELKESNEKEKK